jgi:two-component system, OmpR family, phosphate regulon sensor histidine kinase PhoR
MLSSARLFENSESQLDHKRLMTLINSLSEAFLAVSASGQIELSNGVALSLLDTNSLNGKSIKDAMPILDENQNAINALDLVPQNASSFSSRDYSLRYTDGSIIHLYINLSAVRVGFGSDTKDGFVLLARDITSEKTAEEERDEFISVASHELRNPVAVVEGSLSNAILLSERNQIAGNIGQILKSAHKQVVFLSGLINDLAMISRADRAKLAESAAEFDASEVVRSIQDDYSAQAKKKGLEIKTELVEIKKLFGSRLYTKEILQNFVTNAIKYTEKGNITLKVADTGDGVDLSVADSGIGIDKQEQQKLFTKFFRSDDSRVRKISGTGLGLYVAAKLAKLMGGNINMTSELNHGSVFTLHLPYSIKPAATKVVA